VTDRVGFTGFVAEPDAAMRALDIVVHASTQPEPFGLVIAESMACGRPIVISRGGGAAELIEDGVTGLSFEPGRASDLSACLVKLVDDACLRARLGAAARAVALERFDARRLAVELAPIYEELSRATR
jgi:glycosyltransferase involved in cell wall biosynthesis